MTASSEPAIDGRPEPTIQPGATTETGPEERTGEVGGESTVVAELRRQLMVERERCLNATDRVLGAQAEAAQARAEIRELQYRLHVREAELAEAAELLAQRPETDGPSARRGANAVAERAMAKLRSSAVRVRSR